ncbi:hypothetical protein LguiB_020206 [Lonicera macranthoides]
MRRSSSGGHKDRNKRVTVSPSRQKQPSSDQYSYTSTYSSPLPPPPPSNTPPTTSTNNKSMDEIWKDINLISSLHRPTSAFHLQDFLSPHPPPPPPPPPPPLHLQSQPTSTSRPHSTGRRGGPQSSRSHPPPPPATTLNLSSRLESRNINPKKSKSKQQSCHALVEKPSIISSSLVPPPWGNWRSFANKTWCGTLHSFTNKRRAESEEDQSADGRFKRMIKNRESAARSRDRKHAYTYELELEVARLKKENAKMRRQQEMLCLPAPPAELPKKPTLCRTLTAPF